MRHSYTVSSLYTYDLLLHWPLKATQRRREVDSPRPGRGVKNMLGCEPACKLLQVEDVRSLL